MRALPSICNIYYFNVKKHICPTLVLLDVRVRTEMHAHTFSHWQLFNRLFLLFE